MGPICCPETSVKDYNSKLRNTPEERRSQRWWRQHVPPKQRYPTPGTHGVRAQNITIWFKQLIYSGNSGLTERPANAKRYAHPAHRSHVIWPRLFCLHSQHSTVCCRGYEQLNSIITLVWHAYKFTQSCTLRGTVRRGKYHLEIVQGSLIAARILWCMNTSKFNIASMLYKDTNYILSSNNWSHA
jgi:hypothetical protein